MSLAIKKWLQCGALCVATTTSVQLAHAGASVDQLSQCLEQSISTQDRSHVVQWMFVALSAHPDLAQFSAVTPAQKQQLDQQFATILQTTLVDKCADQTKAVIKNEGLQAVADSFQGLGQATGESILKDPAVNQQLRGTLRYIDLNKVAAAFLTPDVFSQIDPDVFSILMPPRQ